MFTFTERFSPGVLLGGVAGLRRVRARHARAAAAVLAGLAVAVALTPVVESMTAGQVSVVVMARDVGAGQTLTTADLTTASYPGTLVPQAVSTEVAAVVGRRLAAPAARGEPVTTTRLNPARGLAPGEVGVVIPVNAPTASVLKAGDVCDLLDNGKSGTVPLRILEVFTQSSGSSLVANPQATTSILVAIRSQDADKVRGVGAGTPPTLLIRPYS